MPDGVLMSLVRLPLLFRGDVMRQSSVAVLTVTTPLLLIWAVLKVRSGTRAGVAALWVFLGLYASWAVGLLIGEPLAYAVGSGPVDGLRHGLNLVPFATIASQLGSGSGSALVQLIGNAGLLLPLGLFGPVLMPSLRRAPRLALVALGASVMIELVQLAGTSARLIDRSVDVDDVILNVAGALLGWVLWRAVAALRARGKRPARMGTSRA